VSNRCRKSCNRVKSNPRVVQIEAQGIFLIHTTPDSIGGLTIGEPFDILHYHDQRQVPGGYCHRTPLGVDRDGKDLIFIDREELYVEIDVKIAFGESGLHGSSRCLRHWWKDVRMQSHSSPSCIRTLPLFPIRGDARQA